MNPRAGADPRIARAEAGRPVAGLRVATALWITLAALAALEAALASVHSMWGWGANILRFAPPLAGWGLWSAGALALIPLAGRPLARLGAILGDSLAAPGARAWIAAFALALAAGFGVWSAPDRTSFLGDSLLRLDSARAHAPYATTFPQALPIDTFLHSTVPGWITHAWAFDPRYYERALGALKAAASVFVAAAFVRELELSGIAALAATLIAATSGALGLYTGYAKGLSELCLVAACVAWLALRLVRHGRGRLALTLTVTAGLLLHRAAIAFLLPWALAVRHDLRRPREARPAAATLVALALPIVALAVQITHLAKIAATVDRTHLVPPGGPAATLIAMFSALHLIDVANVILRVAPLAPVVPVLLALAPGGEESRAERSVLLALVAPWLVVLLVVHPRQEPVRDWDVFAAAGVALSFLAAWLLGGWLKRAGRSAWLGVPALLLAAAPTMGWIACQSDLPRGLAFVRATLDEPPLRSTDYRARTLHYLGDIETRLGHLDRAAELMQQAATLGPSEAYLKSWANAEIARENVQGAAVATRELARRYPQHEAFDELARIEYSLGNRDAARAAILNAARLAPGDSSVDIGLHVLGLSWADTTRR